MFGWFRSSKQPLFGQDLLDQFKELTASEEDKKLTFYLIQGGASVPLHADAKARKIKEVLFSLTSITGLKDIELLQCSASNKWGGVEDRLRKMTGVMRKHREANEENFKALAKWADQNNVPELSSLDAAAYKQAGMARDPELIQSMRFLYLADLGLQSLPDEISAMPLLQAICVDKNNLTELPEAIGQVTGLQRLDAEDNDLNSLPRSVGKLDYLHTIDLDSNLLTSLPSELRGCKRLKKLRIGSQKHGIGLNLVDSPLDEFAFNALGILESRGCSIYY